MTTPEALRLAEALDRSVLQVSADAAAELRRLHALNKALVDAARQVRDMLNAPEFDCRDVFDVVEDAVKKAEGKE